MEILWIFRVRVGSVSPSFCVFVGRAVVVYHLISFKTNTIQAEKIINKIKFYLGQNTATSELVFRETFKEILPSTERILTLGSLNRKGSYGVSKIQELLDKIYMKSELKIKLCVYPKKVKSPKSKRSGE